MPRDIDHLVVAVSDLEAARTEWQRLGFTLSPSGSSALGTVNAIIQLDGTFVELMAIPDSTEIAEDGVNAFSIAAFNRHFLERHEGISMLALKSRDAEMDRNDFEAAGLPVFAPFNLERTSLRADEGEQAHPLSLAFTAERRLREVGFFTCGHHPQENGTTSDGRRHQNGARRIASAVLVVRDPADYHEFLSKFTGQHDMMSTSLGVRFELGRGAVEVLSPVGYQAWFGELSDRDPRRLLACRIAVADVAETRKVLDRENISYGERMGSLVVPPPAANGVTIAFVDERQLHA